LSDDSGDASVDAGPPVDANGPLFA
jgi:hypothetical protein